MVIVNAILILPLVSFTSSLTAKENCALDGACRDEKRIGEKGGNNLRTVDVLVL